VRCAGAPELESRTLLSKIRAGRCADAPSTTVRSGKRTAEAEAMAAATGGCRKGIDT
jgi:hypothetical protein